LKVVLLFRQQRDSREAVRQQVMLMDCIVTVQVRVNENACVSVISGMGLFVVFLACLRLAPLGLRTGILARAFLLMGRG